MPEGDEPGALCIELNERQRKEAIGRLVADESARLGLLLSPLRGRAWLLGAVVPA